MTVLGSLVLTGCGNNENSTSSSVETTSSSTSSEITRYSVAEALADVGESYTVNYTYEGEKFTKAL